MPLFYYVREFSESEHFPRVHHFTNATQCRNAMIQEAYDVAEMCDGHVCADIDGDPIDQRDAHSKIGEHCSAQRANGRVDCFQMGHVNVQVQVMP